MEFQELDCVKEKANIRQL